METETLTARGGKRRLGEGFSLKLTTLRRQTNLEPPIPLIPARSAERVAPCAECQSHDSTGISQPATKDMHKVNDDLIQTAVTWKVSIHRFSSGLKLVLCTKL